MDIQNRLYMAFIGVDEPPIQPILCLHEGQSRLLDFAIKQKVKIFLEGGGLSRWAMK